MYVSTSGLYPQIPCLLHDYLQCESHETYGPPTAVTWLQQLCKQTNTATPTTLTAETHAHTTSCILPMCWHQSRLANFTCAWSWRLYGISPAISISCTDVKCWAFQLCITYVPDLHLVPKSCTEVRRDFKFSQHCGCLFNSPGMLRYVSSWIVTDVSKGYSVFIFRVKEFRKLRVDAAT
jgi:hypothetical protein